jgi:hypothetical protein
MSKYPIKMTKMTKMKFLGNDGNIYRYPDCYGGFPVMITDNPISLVRDSVAIRPNSTAKWGSQTQFSLHPNIGRSFMHVLSIKHPTIEFDRIVKTISLTIGGDSLQSFSGRALVVYNQLYHPKYYKQGLLVIPFMPYGRINMNNTEEKKDEIDIHISLANRSQESHLKYEKKMKQYVEALLITDIAYVVLAYLGFQYPEAEIIDMSMQVYIKKTRKNMRMQCDNHPSFYMAKSINYLNIFEDIRECCSDFNYSKDLHISLRNPISQICVAFWEKNNFPNFIPVLEHISVGIRKYGDIYSDNKKALIFDKLPHDIHIDEHRPVYTITFSNASEIEGQEIYYSLSDEKEYILRKFPEGTLPPMHSEMYLNITASGIGKPMMMGVWITGFHRFDFLDETSRPHSFVFPR